MESSHSILGFTLPPSDANLFIALSGPARDVRKKQRVRDLLDMAFAMSCKLMIPSPPDLVPGINGQTGRLVLSFLCT